MRTRLVVGLATYGVAALGVVAVVAGCSSSSGGSNPYPDIAHFCAAVAAAECQSTGASSPSAFDNCGATTMQGQECNSFRTAQCAEGSIIVPFPGSADALKRNYTSGNVQACINAIDQVFGSANMSTNGIQSISYTQLFGMGNVVDTCEAVFVGTAADNQACTTNYDCTVMGEVCALNPFGGGSVCAQPSPKNVGDPCADPGDQCTNSYCSTSGSTKEPTCVALLDNNSPCQVDAQCQTSSHCSGGVCAPLAEIGQACAANTDCDVSAGLFCDIYHQGGAACVKSLVFDNGQDDCQGYLFGSGLGSVSDAGAPPPVDAGSPSDSSTSSTDAPTGG
jgi:hypothetical protein